MTKSTDGVLDGSIAIVTGCQAKMEAHLTQVFNGVALQGAQRPEEGFVARGCEVALT